MANPSASYIQHDPTDNSRFSVPHAHTYLVTISGGAGAAAWSVYICDEGRVRLTGDSPRTNPKIVVPPDLVRDSDGLLSTSVTLRNRGPWYSVSATSTVTRHASLPDMMRALGGWVWVSFAAQQAAETVSGESSTAALNGRVVQITNQTAETTTLVLEQRAEIEEKVVPVNTIEPAPLTSGARLEIPERSQAEAIPLPLGRFFPHLPAALYGNCTDARIFGMITAAGIRPGAAPSLEVARKGTEVWYSYAELVSGGLRVPATGDASFTDSAAFVYLPSIDRYAYYWEGTQVNGQSNIAFQDNVASWEGRAQYFKSSRSPYLYLPLMCSEVDEDNSLGLTNGALAIDERAETYATVAYHSSTIEGARWVIPNIEELGRVSQNSTEAGTAANDFEGVGQPVGIYVYALLTTVPGDPDISTGTVRLSAVYIEGDAVFATQGTVNLDLQAGRPQLAVFALPAGDLLTGATNGYDNGWAGTSWPYSFQAAGSDDGDDRPIYNRSVAKPQSSQCRVQVVNRAGGNQRIGVIAVGVRICFRQQWSVAEMNRIPNWDTGTMPKDKYGRPRITIEEYERRKRRIERTQQRRAIVVPERSPYIDRVFFAGNGYKDNGSGTYTGTASATLRQPIHWIHYLLAQYGTAQLATGSSHGSVATARTALDTWADWAHRGAGSATWSQTHNITDQTDVEGAVREIVDAYLPTGSQVIKGPTLWETHVWIPQESSWTKWPTSAGRPVHPVHLLDGPEGPMIEFSSSPDTEIVNDLRIRYDYDIGAGRYLRVATASEEGTDDGYGEEWAATPSTAVDADDVCAWSVARYGQHKRVLDLPGVRDPDVATALGLALLWRHYRPQPRLRMVGTTHLESLRPWHVFRLADDLEDIYGYVPHWWTSGTDWEDRWWRVTRAEQASPEGTAASVEIEAEFVPTLSQIGEGISAGAGTEPDDPGAGTIGEL